MVERREAAKRDYLLGMKYKEIARKYGVSLSAVRAWHTRGQWKKDKLATIKDTLTGKNIHMQNICNAETEIIKYAMVSKDTGLTEKQRDFCLYYVNNRNATTAAIKAGYAKEAAYHCGYANLRKRNVMNEINRLRQIKAESIMLSESDIVERMMRIAFSDMSDIADFGSREIPMLDPMTGRPRLDSKGNPRHRTENYLVFKDVGQVDSCLIAEIKNGKSGMSIKLEDRQKALCWLGDYFCMNPMHKHKIAYDNAVLELRKKETEYKVW